MRQIHQAVSFGRAFESCTADDMKKVFNPRTLRPRGTTTEADKSNLFYQFWTIGVAVRDRLTVCSDNQLAIGVPQLATAPQRI